MLSTGANFFFVSRNKAIRPNIIMAQLLFKEKISIDAVRSLVTEKLLIYPRFRSKMEFSPSQPSLFDIFFEEQSPSDIDLNYHVTMVKGSNWHSADLEDFISKMYMEDMDLDRPLWRMYIINNMADTRHVLLTSINHALGASMRSAPSLSRPASQPSSALRRPIPTSHAATRATRPAPPQATASRWSRSSSACSTTREPAQPPTAPAARPPRPASSRRHRRRRCRRGARTRWRACRC
jgi:hypothetical protein